MSKASVLARPRAGLAHNIIRSTFVSNWFRNVSIWIGNVSKWIGNIFKWNENVSKRNGNWFPIVRNRFPKIGNGFPKIGNMLGISNWKHVRILKKEYVVCHFYSFYLVILVAMSLNFKDTVYVILNLWKVEHRSCNRRSCRWYSFPCPWI